MSSKHILIASAALIALFGFASIAPAEPLVYLLDLDGKVSPAVADYISKGIDKAEKNKAAAVIIRMDTPGGVVSTTKAIIKNMENSRVSVIVYVGPTGSSASSAGALITVAADVAAMAPGTNIGAAHPVLTVGKIDEVLSEKIVNDLTAYMRGIVSEKKRNAEWVDKAIRESVSITAKEALEINVIDLVADSVPQLLDAVDGRTVIKQNNPVTLHTKGAKVERIVTGWRFQILDAIADPNVMYGLFFAGIMGIGAEIYSPGAVLPGVVGTICLLLFAFAAQIMPVSLVGLLLLILGIVLFILEIKITSYGALTIGGIVSLFLGSLMLFDTEDPAMRVSLTVIIPVTLFIAAFFVLGMSLAAKAWLSKPRTGEQGLVGEVGTAATDLSLEGKVLIHGEYWSAIADTHIPKGEKVKVLRVDNLSIQVTRDTAVG
jgi:membrane-bound serine protease (ClpP class)